MTSQTQKFIELCDILALKLECKSCHSSLAIPSERHMAAREEIGKLGSCPICRAPWAILGGSSYEPLIIEFVSALNKLRGAFNNAPIGFNLTLEVTGEELGQESQ
jgi:hypothetical protein